MAKALPAIQAMPFSVRLIETGDAEIALEIHYTDLRYRRSE